MKKLLLILLPISIFLVSCGGGEGDLQPIDPPTLSLEETLVGKKWCLSNEDEDGFILSPGGGFFTTKKCTPHDWEGSWVIEGNLIKYSYTQNSIQTTVLWGEVTEYSATEVKILEESSTTLTTEKVYYITPEDIYGCMDSDDPNYNPNANCDTNMCSYTYIPDDNFEQALINLGYDNILDDYVYKANIDTITVLNVIEKNISDLTGIEDFSALTILRCWLNQLTSLDVSQNTALISLYCNANQLTSLDVSNNTNLTKLNCDYNQLTSLDVSNNTNLTEFACDGNQLTSLDVSQNTAIMELNCHDNQLTSLDVSQNTALMILTCQENQLTSLDLSNNTNLIRLQCGTNQLTSLDVSNGNNTNIPEYWFSTINNNQLYCIEVDNAAWSTSNWTDIDPQHYFSEDCP